MFIAVFVNAPVTHSTGIMWVLWKFVAMYVKYFRFTLRFTIFLIDNITFCLRNEKTTKPRNLVPLDENNVPHLIGTTTEILSFQVVYNKVIKRELDFRVE